MKTARPFLIFIGVAALLLSNACSRQETEPVADESAADVADISTPEPGALTLPPRSVSPAGAAVFFITPANGDTVVNPIPLEFGVDGMSVVAAGVHEDHSGHHHLLVDTDPPNMGLPIPADAHHIHFGNASTSTELTLAPGEHTLRLLLGDYLHIPHDPPVMSDPITITVE